MTKEQFFDWLSGYFDICEPDRIGVVETQTIKDHIDLVRGVEKLPPAMTEVDAEKFLCDLPPIESLSKEGKTHSNFSPPQIKKSSGGRGRPTIEAPPPPVKVFPQDYPALNPVGFEDLFAEYLKGPLPKLPPKSPHPVYYC